MTLLIPLDFAVNELLPTAEILLHHGHSRSWVDIDYRTILTQASSGPERQSPMQPHTDLNKVRLILRRNDAMSDKEVHQHRSRVRLELLA